MSKSSSEAIKRAPRPAVEGPSVLVLHEKHGNQYFNVPDEPALFKAALEILKARLKAGWYYDPEDSKPKDPGATRAEVGAMKPGPIRQFSAAVVRRYEEELRWWKHLKEQWLGIQQSVKDADAKLAWRLLRERSDHEYENVSIERFCKEYRA